VNQRDAMQQEVDQFAKDVGASDPVTVVGGRTHWQVGGLPEPEAREVRAPEGVWAHEPEEMTVRCGAGTTLGQLSEELARHGQMVPFDMDANATVGGVLAVGRSGFRRLRYGHVRDLVLQIRHIDHKGRIVSSGGPTVKNVSGYDLCRLLVGSLGKFGCIAEVTLRCLPIPETTQWFTGSLDPFELHKKLYRPSSILWNGLQVWVCLEGVASDVAAQAATFDFEEAPGPPPFPTVGRLSVEPKDLQRHVTSSKLACLAEVGVGIIHTNEVTHSRSIPEVNLSLMRELEERLDPNGRLNPGRQVLNR